MTDTNPNPFTGRDACTDILSEIARQPLACCPQFPAIARRFEAWWQTASTDRPLFIGATKKEGVDRVINRRLNLLTEPDAWFEAKCRDRESIRFVGDAVPAIRADFGPVLLGGMLGGRLEFGADTGWTHAFINDDWSNAPDWILRDDNPWWRLLCNLAERVSEDAAGRYLFMTPDLGGAGDVLLNLRGSEPLCLDVMMQPEHITDAVTRMYPAWQRAFAALYGIALKHRTGLVQWLGLWSSQPYTVPACDFNYLISPDSFRDLLLDDIAKQSEAVGRAVFHLDGPGAARHIDALLEVPGLHIQFTPGEGSPSALPWLDMFKKVQARGRSLLIICRSHEIQELCDNLRPEGLAFLIDSPPAESVLLAQFEALRKRFGVEEDAEG